MLEHYLELSLFVKNMLIRYLLLSPQTVIPNTEGTAKNDGQ
jgi:hypothetical protein